MCDAVLHSDVEAKGKISVLGRKGLINGGHIRSYASIAATQLGSMMGTSTTVEIMSDVELMKSQIAIEERLKQSREAMEKMNTLLIAIKKFMQQGNELTPEQTKYLKIAKITKPKLLKEVEDLEIQYDSLQKVIDEATNVDIRVENVVNSGVKIVIKDISRIINDNVSACKFVREGADIKSLSIY